jgi:hypothetical protein
MKLTYFSEQTFPKQSRGGGGLPKIGFSKAGIIAFNKQAVELAALKAKDKITLAQDPDHPENWFFFKDTQHGFELRAGYKGKTMVFNHSELSKAFLESCGRDLGKGHSLKIAGQPTVINGDKTKYWGILI